VSTGSSSHGDDQGVSQSQCVDQRVSPEVPMTAWAAARRAIGTRNGEHDT
jgi:hypothetical protein